MTKIKGLEGIYNLREIALDQMIILSNKTHSNNTNIKYITKIRNEIIDLYNSLTDVIRFIEAIYY